MNCKECGRNIVAYLKALYRNLSGRAEKTHENLSG